LPRRHVRWDGLLGLSAPAPGMLGAVNHKRDATGLWREEGLQRALCPARGSARERRKRIERASEGRYPHTVMGDLISQFVSDYEGRNLKFLNVVKEIQFASSGHSGGAGVQGWIVSTRLRSYSNSIQAPTHFEDGTIGQSLCPCPAEWCTEVARRAYIPTRITLGGIHSFESFKWQAFRMNS